MSEFIDILNLISVGRSMEACVGWRNGVEIGYADFLGRLRAWQAMLLATAGDNFALYADDSIEFAAMLFGAWHAGKTIYLPSDTLPATCASLRSEVDGFLGDFPQAYAPLHPEPGHGAAVGRAGNTPAALPGERVALVVYTSGSTGAPQAIPKKLSQLACEVATLEREFGPAASAAEFVATVSHQHIYGLLFKVLWPLASGRGIHAHSIIYPEQLAQLTAARDCVLVSSPAHLKRLPESAAWMTAAHRIRLVFSSGGPLPPETAHATADLLGRAPVEVYGSSETGGIAWRQRTRDSDESWLPLPGVEIRIAGQADALEVRSPHLPDNDWFRTADRAGIRGDGKRFLLHGRADRIVKIEEKRISLDLIEASLKKTQWVADARVLVTEGRGRRQRVAAFVVLTDGGRKLLADGGKHALNETLRTALAVAVERIALPRTWRYLDALPVNAVGKTTHAELMALLEDAAEVVKDSEHAGTAPAMAPARPTMPHMHLVEQAPTQLLVTMSAPPDLLYFEGHFAGVPILPGVAQVEWAHALARQYFILPPAFLGIHTLKFQQVIRPGMPFSLEMSHDTEKNQVSFKYFSEGGVHASGRLMFGAAHV